MYFSLRNSGRNCIHRKHACYIKGQLSKESCKQLVFLMYEGERK